jgi:hypothetical protein
VEERRSTTLEVLPPAASLDLQPGRLPACHSRWRRTCCSGRNAIPPNTRALAPPAITAAHWDRTAWRNIPLRAMVWSKEQPTTNKLKPKQTPIGCQHHTKCKTWASDVVESFPRARTARLEHTDDDSCYLGLSNATAHKKECLSGGDQIWFKKPRHKIYLLQLSELLRRCNAKNANKCRAHPIVPLTAEVSLLHSRCTLARFSIGKQRTRGMLVHFREPSELLHL